MALLLLAGCSGEGGGGTPVASAPGGAPPPPPSAPPPPPAPPAPTEPVPAEPMPNEIPAEPAPTEPAPAEPTPPPSENPAPAPTDPNAIPAPADPNANPAAPEKPKPPTLRERALTAFHAGKDDEAFQLLATHYLIALEDSDDLVTKMQWVPGLRRPALATRFGLVVAYTPPKDFKESPQPIGSKEAATAYAANLGQAGNNDPNAPAPQEEQAGTVPESTNAALTSLAWYTGEVGTKLAAALKGKAESGTLGLTLQEATSYAPPVDPNAPPAAPAEAHDPNDKNHNHPGQLSPGIVFLGVASEGNAAALGKRSQADVLVTLEVAARPAKTISFVQNDIKLRVTNVKTGQVIFVSDQINNLKVLEGRRKGAKGEDPVDKEIGEALAAIEKSFTPGPLPDAVTAEIATKRIKDLAAEKPSDQNQILAILLEARYYVAKGLMKDEELMTVMMDAIGPDKLAQIMKRVEGADLDALLGKVLADPNLGKLLEGQDPAKLLPGLAPGGKIDAGALLEKLFPKSGEKPADKPAEGADKPAEPAPR
ncbi:MAG: hypothetical protein SFU86_03845 [Pirellulaceae bacterium]|nr:hypothetical protein [Pirellulaceae bacterium]